MTRTARNLDLVLAGSVPFTTITLLLLTHTI